MTSIVVLVIDTGTNMASNSAPI